MAFLQCVIASVSVPSHGPAQPQRHTKRRAPFSRREPRCSAAVDHDSSITQQFTQLKDCLTPRECCVVAAPTPLGRGLVATQRVPAGTTLLSVDWVHMLCITDNPGQGNAFGKSVLTDWQQLHGRLPPLLVRFLLSADQGDWFTRLVAYLLWVKQHSAQGPWQMYIDMLPQVDELTHLMNYRPDELDEFQSTSYAALASRERSQIQNLHETLFSSSTGELKALKLADSLDDTVWGCCMVNSRGFSDVVRGESVSLLVPLADMANHSLEPNTGFRFNWEEDAFEMIVRQDLEAGAEACISYGCTQKDNQGLMRDYGFVLPGNYNDRVPFSAGDDVASQLAARAAGGGGRSQGRPSLDAQRLLAALGLEPERSGGSYTLNTAAQAVMGSSERDAAERRRLVAVMSLQPFLRMPGRGGGSGGGGTNAVPQLREPELQRERQSVDTLMAQCSSMLASMPTSVETDEQLLAAGDGAGGGAGPPMSVRRQQAVRARLENKRLLLAAQAVLQQYADSLC